MASFYDLGALVGQEIVENAVVFLGSEGKGIKKHKWTVIEAYPYFVRTMRICENGAEVFNTFNLGELITMGVIK